MSRDNAVKIGSLAFGFAALLAFLAFLFAVTRGPIVEPVPQPITGPNVEELAFGWEPNPEAVEAFRATLDVPDFADTPAGRVAMGEMPSRVYLWQTIRKVTGKDPPIYDQNPVGSCVSFGTARGIEASLATQIALGERFEWKPLVEEVIYAGSRIEVGKGQIRRSRQNPTGDGSHGGWAAEFVKKWGAPPRGVYKVGGKTYDLTKYNPTMCRAWGESGSQGVPDDLEPEARKYPVGDVTQITTWSEAKKALAQGYGIAVCSNVGFAPDRDSNGVARADRSWAHCMCLDGYHVDENTGKEYGHIQNSWGTIYHRGPVGWGEPPESGFWAEAAIVQRMLNEWKDSWAFSAVKGFPSRKIDWYAFHQPQRRMERVFASLKEFAR